MDVFSHGLWGGIVLARKKLFWQAALFGMLPDLLAFGPWMIVSALRGELRSGKPDKARIPAWVFTIYNLTHSLIVAGAGFTLLWFFKRELAIVSLAWPLHILLDIPTHTRDFFPTKFLYPLSSFHVHGISWSNRYVFISNWLALALVYGLWFWHRTIVG